MIIIKNPNNSQYRDRLVGKLTRSSATTLKWILRCKQHQFINPTILFSIPLSGFELASDIWYVIHGFQLYSVDFISTGRISYILHYWNAFWSGVSVACNSWISKSLMLQNGILWKGQQLATRSREQKLTLRGNCFSIYCNNALAYFSHSLFILDIW